ncbi:MAG: hypothetical protein H6857_00180 [Rhodospirillales bacterium]|nr:hypothetical protein [Rhodospirillales bacterium]
MKLRNGLLFVVLMASFFLSACGFTPIYATSGTASQSSLSSVVQQIEISNIPDRSGQFLRNALVDRLNAQGTPSAPAYRLEISDLSETVRDMDVTIRSDATREQMKLSANLALRDLETQQIVMTKKLSATGSYNILEGEYTTRVSRQNLRESLLTRLSEQAERSVMLFLGR